LVLLLGYRREFLEVTIVLLSPHLLEDINIMATLLEEDGIFGSHIDVCHLQQVVGVCIVCFVAINRYQSHIFGRDLHSTHYLVHVLVPLGACFLTTYSHKHLHLKTRVYVRYNSIDATNNGVGVTYNVTYKGVKVYICATHDTTIHYVTSN